MSARPRPRPITNSRGPLTAQYQTSQSRSRSSSRNNVKVEQPQKSSNMNVKRKMSKNLLKHKLGNMEGYIHALKEKSNLSELINQSKQIDDEELIRIRRQYKPPMVGKYSEANELVVPLTEAEKKKKKKSKSKSIKKAREKASAKANSISSNMNVKKMSKNLLKHKLENMERHIKSLKEKSNQRLPPNILDINQNSASNLSESINESNKSISSNESSKSISNDSNSNNSNLSNSTNDNLYTNMVHLNKDGRMRRHKLRTDMDKLIIEYLRSDLVEYTKGDPFLKTIRKLRRLESKYLNKYPNEQHLFKKELIENYKMYADAFEKKMLKNMNTALEIKDTKRHVRKLINDGTLQESDLLRIQRKTIKEHEHHVEIFLWLYSRILFLEADMVKHVNRNEQLKLSRKAKSVSGPLVLTHANRKKLANRTRKSF
jgi:hypothetical protein